ncbi:alcohol dehydrogenase catalytic domain-containing protein [Oceanobacillus kimchii]|uniref:zinc-dependent alcohol dehydrogenase n=1 Tax=Oceanobacillus TaxID=182709 RepID=UPI0003468BF1|nr:MULTISPECIES: alcohol dehydrogenase catalytic domain-containing protein [Oceanobacillus]MCT1578426.1 alcohol dehydrogenase catalytic domain-containing protein [Oceanobacillus kimchii]MCT2134604.1 alcohol dehydrogenase catalytic domain-containing protein [Oceanobacillus kimchii]OEH54785.1 galactitol-1-phosphate 5-dehydrogenase [Oceanobacillus sp. E9]
MKVLSWNGPKEMDIEERPIPEVKQDEVLVKVDVVGLCGSEIEGFLGHNSLRIPPLVMGHEFSGRVADIGESVTGIVKGTKVVVNPLLTCGTCKQCIRGNETQCEHREIIGIHRSGAFAEYVAVPGSSIVEIPEELDSFAASLAEPLACTFRAIRRAISMHTVPNILVYGAGAIGLLSAFVAKELGANKVIVADINEDRLQTLTKVGIEDTLNNSKDDFEDKLNEITGYKGIDVVIDAVGFQPTRTQSANVVNPGGVIMNVGLGIDETIVPINHYIRSEITVLGSFCYSRQDFLDAVQLLIEEKITPKGWTEVRSLEDGQQSFMDLVEGKVKSSKIFLDLNR